MRAAFDFAAFKRVVVEIHLCRVFAEIFSAVIRIVNDQVGVASRVGSFLCAERVQTFAACVLAVATN